MRNCSLFQLLLVKKLLTNKNYYSIYSGVHWVKKDNFFLKKIMAPGCSLQSLQWLTFLQKNDPRLINAAGERVQLEHKFYRGEKRIDNWYVDGYARVDGQELFYEFLGCYFHRGCNNSRCRNFDPSGVDEVFERKKLELTEYGEVVTIRGCEWEDKLRKIKWQKTEIFPDIYNVFSNEKKILKGIEDDNLFGFLVADVTTPADVLEKILPLNFPPIIHRGSIDETMTSEYMRARCEANNKKLPQETLIQTYNAKQIMIYSPTARFYLQLGLKISNVTKFIQFLPTRPLKSFVEKITNGRINAVKSGNDSLGTAYKIIGNS